MMKGAPTMEHNNPLFTIVAEARTMRAMGRPLLLPAMLMLACWSTGATAQVVDTGQSRCYDDWQEITCPSPGEPFYGQDAQYSGAQPGYMDNGDGTVSDINTGLMWQKSPDLENRSTYAEALAGARSCRLAGHDDWRLPTIKELYSLIDFRGSGKTGTPYIDTRFFDFRFGDSNRGERPIDAQYWSSNEYAGKVFGNRTAVFGVNFADGRIKGYPSESRGKKQEGRFVRYVRGATGYGINRFVDNGDGTVTDHTSGLTWMKADSQTAMSWQDALAFAENLSFAGHDDWRLPNAKELQSIVDYSRAPDAADPGRRGPALDPVFDITESESWFWASTTLMEGPNASHAVYIAFGQAFGVYQDRQGQQRLVNVHGAGAQRSDPKSGDPGSWVDGHGPQNDQIRILNSARAVRGQATAAKSVARDSYQPSRQALSSSSGPDRQPFSPPGAGQGRSRQGSGSQRDQSDRPGRQSGRQGAGQGHRGPSPCTTETDCKVAGACPPDAGRGCTCAQTPEGTRLCIPACRSDSDCPKPPGVTLRCHTEQGICVPEGISRPRNP
jgi:hypothetical protein